MKVVAAAAAAAADQLKTEKSKQHDRNDEVHRYLASSREYYLGDVY